MLSLAKIGNRSRKTPNEPPVAAEVPEVIHLQQKLERIQLKSWGYVHRPSDYHLTKVLSMSDGASAFIRPPKNSDRNVLSQIVGFPC